MAILQLIAGNKYLLKTTRISPKNKQIPRQDGKKYWLFDIWIEDKKEDFVQAEICSLDQHDSGAVMNVFQWFECEYLSSKQTPTVKPCDPPGERPYTPPVATIDRIPVDLTYKPKCSSVNISGSSLAFAMAYSKDLLVAEIGNSQPEFIAGDDDIDRMLRRADIINDWFCQKING